MSLTFLRMSDSSAGNEAGFDRLSQPNVVSNEQVHPREL